MMRFALLFALSGLCTIGCAKPNRYDVDAAPDSVVERDVGMGSEAMIEVPGADAVPADGAPLDSPPTSDGPAPDLVGPMPDAGPDSSFCPSTCFMDKDGDGFGDPTMPQLACTDANQCEAGFVTNDMDCYDGSGDAKPSLLVVAQRPFRDTHRGDGKWDFNCDGVEEKEIPATWTGCAQDCSMVPATPLPTPACGQMFEHTTCVPGLGGQQCGPRKVTALQRCR